jgi:hypothetical protein
MDAIGKGVRDTRSRECSQTSLYNAIRPHQALDHRTSMATWRESISGGSREMACGHDAALGQR